MLQQGMETKPAPGDAGTGSGTDDDAKASNAAERGLRNHRKRKAPDAHKPKQAAAQHAHEAVEPVPSHKRLNRGVPKPAGVLSGPACNVAESCVRAVTTTQVAERSHSHLGCEASIRTC